MRVSGGIPPREDVLTETASPLQQELSRPVSAGDPALPPAAPQDDGVDEVSLVLPFK